MSKPVYELKKFKEWGETVWVLYTANSSPFGRYATKAEAMKDVKKYHLTIAVEH